MKTTALAALISWPSFATAEWTGLYVGGEVGGIDSAPIAGAFAGFQYQIGRVVPGIEIGYDTLLGDTSNGAEAGLDFTGISFRLGWDFDDIMPYVGYGGSYSVTEEDDDLDLQALFKLGLDYRYSDNVTIGLQYKSQITIFDTSSDDALAQGISLRASYAF
ncbi:outer membrane protein [Cognatiyoonia sp. IB215182]|uniref:outer membrane protein n=1 Tax=Cognatiyoonia sp. IB215182 TaxID=3097353 RepID=UPI002A0C2A86|nr:outer membrane beta-barrel protein [Cognatiyoonia sp. IB215182]MDX8351675.1 outer membrane beta-barrel protein [Cognatiyoonia sp. IB215182]